MKRFASGPALALLLALAACGGAAGDAAPEAASEPRATAASPATVEVPDLGFPTGPAVTVAGNYAPPTDRVDSTGAYLPANGLPTLVFVDAIW